MSYFMPYFHALLPCPTFGAPKVGHEVGHEVGHGGGHGGGHHALLPCPTFHALLSGKVGHGAKRQNIGIMHHLRMPYFLVWSFPC